MVAGDPGPSCLVCDVVRELDQRLAGLPQALSNFRPAVIRRAAALFGVVQGEAQEVRQRPRVEFGIAGLVR